MYDTADAVICRIGPEKGARLRKFFENAPIREQMLLVRIYPDSFSLARVLVADDKLRLADLLLDCKNRPEVTTAFSALKALKTQDNPSSFFLLSGHHENIELRLKK